MAFFRNGSEISMPLLIPSNSPLNAKEVADSVAQVLSDLPVDERYVGMAIFCEAENKVYRFTKHDDGTGTLTSGVEDSDFRVDTMSVNTDTLIEVVGTLAAPIASDLGKYVLLSTNNIIYKCMLDVDGVTYKWVNVTKKGVEIVSNYSLLPTVTDDTICYVVDDYTDTTVAPNVTHEKGFYLYHNNGVSPAEWKLIGGQAKVELKKEIDNNYIAAVTINGTNENILCEKKIETIGSEVREILIAKAPSSDGSINVGDVVSIKKTINSVIIFEYNILDDNTIHDPFA